jgi:hypothetical protein
MNIVTDNFGEGQTLFSKPTYYFSVRRGRGEGTEGAVDKGLSGRMRNREGTWK